MGACVEDGDLCDTGDLCAVRKTVEGKVIEMVAVVWARYVSMGSPQSGSSVNVCEFPNPGGQLPCG